MDRIKESIDRLENLVKSSLDEYSSELIRGSEPLFPMWTVDVQVVLKELKDRLVKESVSENRDVEQE